MRRASMISVVLLVLAVALAKAASEEYPPYKEDYKSETKPKEEYSPSEEYPKEHSPSPSEEEEEEYPKGHTPSKEEEEEYPKGHTPSKEEEEEEYPKGHTPSKEEEEEYPKGHTPSKEEEEEEYPKGHTPSKEDKPKPTPKPKEDDEYSPVPTTPSSAVSAKQVRCKNKKYPFCYYRQFTCPAACPDSCEVDCVTCSPVCNCNKPGAVCQDPRFVGADGITFYFHGKKDRDFCLVTDSNLHINARFIGKRNPTVGRDFTWVQSLGILFEDHKLYIGALKTATWDDATDRLALSYDGQPITLQESNGASWQSSTGRVTVIRSKATNAVEIEVEGKFKIKAVVVPITEKDSMIHKYGITQEDCFAHLDLSFKFYSLSGEVNGVLGQTYASNYVSRVKMGVAMPVLGGEKEFSSSSLFSTDCVVARFTGKTDEKSSEGMEFVDLNCATGLSGPGVVCRR